MSRETGENRDEGGEPPYDGSTEAEPVENPWVRPKPDNPDAFGERMRALTPGGEAPATEPTEADAAPETPKAEVGTSEDERLEQARRLEEARGLAALAATGIKPVKVHRAPGKSTEQPGATQQDLGRVREQNPEQRRGLENGLGD
ncbi:hypothetical protein [Streptomyces sp. NBC_01233]|uniref:hypothetical protein n=1 Tax=Streptomyces sp. NBC_01233 TaxID=2903787 RepID=UPI002E13B477|nr:hypothetical protein OG332_07040 [Streptomyces sp. NBC_01233]